jgi:voltage-gated potassium channel
LNYDSGSRKFTANIAQIYRILPIYTRSPLPRKLAEKRRIKTMTQANATPRQYSHAYNIFILVLTVLSLVIMVVMFLPLGDATIGLLQVYDNLICLIFLADFFITLRAAPDKSGYMLKRGGWLDLLGSIPSFGSVFKFSGLLRLARLSRLIRIARKLSREEKAALIRDVLENRSQYAVIITVLMTIFILASASVLVLEFESQSQGANIRSGMDSLWYSLVTITTVGYGDRYPVTLGGRITAMFIMFTGVGIIGALASTLSSLLVGTTPAPRQEETPTPALVPAIEQELENIKNEMVALRQILEKLSRDGDLRS